MRRYVAACLISAFLGGLFAVWLLHGRFDSPLMGQDSARGRGDVDESPFRPLEPDPESSDGRRAGVRRPEIADAELAEFTPEERIYVDRDYADVILAVDGKKVATGDELLDYIESKRPNDAVTVRVLRDEREEDIRVVLGSDD